MNEIYKRILIKFSLWFICGFIICIVGISNVFAVSITDYATKYYYYSANDNSSTTSTDYRSGSSNKVTLDGASAPTYANGEGFNGFYNRINYSISKGSIYTLSLALSYSSLQDGEFSSNTINNRLLNTDFAHCSNCTITAVSGSIRRYNSTNQGVSGLYDYVVQMSYTFVATSDVSTWYIGSYTGDDRTFGLDNHLYTSIVMINNLEISNDNSSTIINQNDTIINQNQQMIDQSQQNTQDIINNNNQNTQSIIDSNKENFNDCRDSMNLFNPNNVENGYVSDNTGALGGVNSANKNTGYIEIKSSTKYFILANKTNGNWGAFYDTNKNYISGIKQALFSNGKTIIESPSNAKYLRFTVSYNNNNTDFANNVMIAESSTEIQYEKFGDEICVNKLDEQTNAINGLNDNINDDNTDEATSEASDFFSEFNTNTFGLTSIITAPLSLIQSITSSTCNDLELPLPYLNNKKLILPCMTTIYSTYFGTFFTLYQTITYGIIAYWVCVRIFNQVKDFKNPEHDEIEVVDL